MIHLIGDVHNNGDRLIKYYRENPCAAAKDLLGVDLDWVQRAVLRDIWFKRYTILLATRGYGKTFLLGLAAALSALLYPGWRVGLISGTFRQCFPIVSNSYDTFWTSHGLVTTTESFFTSIDIGNTKVQSLENQNIILNKWHNNERSCIKIETTKGYNISGTIDHGVLVLSDNLSLDYRELQDITEGDSLVIKKGFNYFGNTCKLPIFNNSTSDKRIKPITIPTALTSNLAYLLGLIIGDGCLSMGNKKYKLNSVVFTNSDKELLNYFELYMKEFFIGNQDIIYKHKTNETYNACFTSKLLTQYLLLCGITCTTALDKSIPEVIKRAPKEYFLSFLQGLFDTDGCVYVQMHSHGYTHCEVSLSTSSLQLAKEVQATLLNIGIISNLAVSKRAGNRKLLNRTKDSICATAYKVRITNNHNLALFSQLVGFRLKRKQVLLESAINSCKVRGDGFVLVGHNDSILPIVEECIKYSTIAEDKKYLKSLYYRIKSSSSGIKESSLLYIIDFCKRAAIESNMGLAYTNLKYIVDNNLFVVQPKHIESFSAPSIDIEVDNEHCYWANGFINHNSKKIFAETEKLYENSPIFQEAVAKPPVHASDSYYIEFKGVGGRKSRIEALPLGDGGKIRGSRFFFIIVDELAQVDPTVLDTVVRPMAATKMNPMLNVERVKQKRHLIELGLADESIFDDQDGDLVNKIVYASSGYFKFNHMWQRMCYYWDKIEEAESSGKKPKHAVWQIPYWHLSEGFLEMDVINESKSQMSDIEFRMEYCAEMVSDSEGFFKASVIETCVSHDFTVEVTGDPACEYVLGVDPQQGGSDNCGLVVLKITADGYRIVYVRDLDAKTTKNIATSIRKLCRDFNIIRIFMDKGGGGSSVSEWLADDPLEEPLLTYDLDDHIGKKGTFKVNLVNFNTTWIRDANFSLLAALELKRMLFPGPPKYNHSDFVESIYEQIETLKHQLLSIIVTQNKMGTLHFDTPKKGQRKDLYSALLIALFGAKELEKDTGLVNVLFSGGVYRSHSGESSSGWSTIDGMRPAKANVLSGAVLTLKPK